MKSWITLTTLSLAIGFSALYSPNLAAANGRAEPNKCVRDSYTMRAACRIGCNKHILNQTGLAPACLASCETDLTRHLAACNR